MQPSSVAVIGGGPVGAATAHALALQLAATGEMIHWFDSNRPLDADFTGMSMSCPWAAGQVLAQSFEPDTLAKRMGVRTLQALRELDARGLLPMQPRPWLVCAPKGDDPLDCTTREVLDAAWRGGAMEGFSLLRGEDLRRFPGVLHERIAFAVCDEKALAVDPRALAVGLSRWAANMPGVLPHFGTRVTHLEGNELHAECDGKSLRIQVRAVVLCVGIHVDALSVNGVSLASLAPPARVTHLHVFDHRSEEHRPSVLCSVAGAATIARYEVFGDSRHAIVPHLPQVAREMDINPLLTDVPGLRRLLDTHFESRQLAEGYTAKAPGAIAGLLQELLEPRFLPGHRDCDTPITQSSIAGYIKHAQPDGNPILKLLDTDLPMLYVQPTNGRGVTQCIGLGEAAAKAVASF